MENDGAMSITPVIKQEKVDETDNLEPISSDNFNPPENSIFEDQNLNNIPIKQEIDESILQSEKILRGKERVLSEGEASSGFETVSSVESKYSPFETDLSSLEDFNVVVQIENELAYSNSNDFRDNWDECPDGAYDYEDDIETVISSPPRQYKSERKSSEHKGRDRESRRRSSERWSRRERREKVSDERDDCDRSRPRDRPRRKKSKSRERKRSRDRSYERRKKERRFDIRSRTPIYRDIRKTRRDAKDSENSNNDQSPSFNRKFYSGNENKFSVDEPKYNGERKGSSSDDCLDRRSRKRRRRRSRSGSPSDPERSFSRKRRRNRERSDDRSDRRSRGRYTREIKKERTPFLVEIERKLEAIKTEKNAEVEVIFLDSEKNSESPAIPETSLESSPYPPTSDTLVLPTSDQAEASTSDSYAPNLDLPVPPGVDLPAPPGVDIPTLHTADPYAPSTSDPPPPPTTDQPAPPPPPPAPPEPPKPPTSDPPIPPEPPNSDPPLPPAPPPDSHASFNSKPPEPPPSDASLPSIPVVMHSCSTLPSKNHSYPTVGLDNMPLVQGPTGLPVHVTVTGECIPYDMEGRRIPIGPNGFYLPLDSSGRLFPHIMSSANTPIPVHMSEDGVLRLPNLEPVPYGPNLPINIDGSLIHIGPDSRPLFPYLNLPKLTSVIPLHGAPSNNQPESLPPEPVRTEQDIDVTYLIQDTSTNINRAELVKKYKKKVREKTEDFIKCKEIEKNLGVSSSLGGVKRSTPARIGVKKNLRDDRNEVCDMVLESSDSDSGEPSRPEKQNTDEPSNLVSLESQSEDPIVKKIQQAIKSLYDREFKPPPSGRFILPTISSDISEEVSSNESPLWRNSLKFVSITPCPNRASKQNKPLSGKGVINFSFIPQKDGSYTKPKSAFEFNRLKKIIPTAKPQSVFTFDFSMQCDFTSDVIKKLNDNIAVLNKEIDTLKDVNAQLTDAFKKSQASNEQISLELTRAGDDVVEKEKEIKFLKLAIAEKERREMDKLFHSNV